MYYPLYVQAITQHIVLPVLMSLCLDVYYLVYTYMYSTQLYHLS